MAERAVDPQVEENTNRAPTIRQVAERAGVSTATVSRVFSGSGLVREELVQRVQNAARELNYQPNRVARNLRTKKTNLAALIVCDIENPFFTSVVRGVEGVLKRAGYSLLLADSNEDEDQEWEHIQNLRAEGVAGFILAPSGVDARKYQQLVQSGIALVLIDRVPRDLSVDRVTVNNFDAARLAVQHLVSQQHRAIGFISGLSKISTSLERQKGYEQALIECGLEARKAWVQEGYFRQEGGYEAMKRLLALPDPPTAVIAANNLMTLGALQALNESGVRVPMDMALVGFDDMDWANALNPPLTAIAQPNQDMGRIAAEILLDRVIHRNRPNRHMILDTQLIVRASSGPHVRRGAG